MSRRFAHLAITARQEGSNRSNVPEDITVLQEVIAHLRVRVSHFAQLEVLARNPSPVLLFS